MTPDPWLRAALDYLPTWIAHQMRQSGQPGCLLAVAHRGQVVLEQAFASADLSTAEAMTPRHRFRVASHSKSLTAAGVMRLREKGRLSLDAPIGRHLEGLHPEIAALTLAQLLSHSGGITRDGTVQDAFADRRSFASRAELLADLAEGPRIPPGTRFKYSNHGFALAALVVEAVTGTPWADWIRQEVMEPFGLSETFPDCPLPPGTPFARGHTGRMPLGRRLVIPGDNTAHAIAPAGGVVSTAADMARFYAQLSPDAAESPLSVASRREMVRRQWRNPHASFEMWYGLGIMSGTLAGGLEWFGHTGRLQGYVSRTAVLPAFDIAVSVMVNGIDALTELWADGALNILRCFAQRGAPAERLKDWMGRWWTVWGAVDLLPAGERVLVATPSLFNPVMDAAEIEATGDEGRVVLATGYAGHGEPARLIRDAEGRVAAVELGSMRMVPEAELSAELAARYGG